MLKRFFSALALCWICLLPNTAQAEESLIPQKYTVLRESLKNLDKTLPNIHPTIPNAERNYVMVSVQEGDLLRVAFYRPDQKTATERFDVHNPTGRNFTGIAAELCVSCDPSVNMVKFADGTILKPYLPPDAQPIGSEEWRYQMRWRQVYKNYYFVTVYRGAGVVCLDALVTTKDGQDISLPLGETSVNADNSKYFALGVNEVVVHYYQDGRSIREKDQSLFWDPEKIKQLTLIPVEEKDLPPDFPKGLVRWIP